MTIVSNPRGRAAVLALATMCGMPTLALACELDGLSHGYGPMSALFAGAHRYQSLNGLEDEESPPEPPPPAPEAAAIAEGARPASPATTPPPTASPPRSFVAWAKAKPKASGGGDAPASWVAPPGTPSADAARGAPERAEAERGEQEQRRPSGRPVP